MQVAVVPCSPIAAELVSEPIIIIINIDKNQLRNEYSPEPEFGARDEATRGEAGHSGHETGAGIGQA